jgi:hypothetical protein
MIFRKENKLIWMLKPLSCALLLLSVFAIVWLRSSIVSLEYSISNLEKKRTELAVSKKLLSAERAKLLSAGRFENVSARGFVFPDRVKVVHVKKAGLEEPYRASFER